MQFGDAPQAPLNGAYYPDEDMQETTGEGDTRIRSMGNIKGDETETEMTEKKSTLDYTMGDANTIGMLSTYPPLIFADGRDKLNN